MPTTAALSLGASIGDRLRSLRLAGRVLDAQPAVRVVRSSAVHATPPVGGVARAPFLNAVLRIETTLAPTQLLALCRTVELRLGRRPTRSWADRILDIDVLLYGQSMLSAAGIRIPHPRLAERDFLLEALAEAWPEAVNPWTGLPWVATLRARRTYPVVAPYPR